MKFIVTIIASIFIIFAALAIADGIKGIYKEKSELKPNWEKTVGTLETVNFVNNIELIVEYNFEWQNKTYSHLYSETGEPDTGKRNQLNFIYEQIKDAKNISIWLNSNKLTESSIFPVRNIQLPTSIYQIKFGLAMLVLPLGLIFFMWILKSPEKGVFENIKILELK